MSACGTCGAPEGTPHAVNCAAELNRAAHALVVKMRDFATELLDPLECREPAYGAPGYAHCAACCRGTLLVVTCEEDQAIVAAHALEHAARLLDAHLSEELVGRLDTAIAAARERPSP